MEDAEPEEMWENIKNTVHQAAEEHYDKKSGGMLRQLEIRTV